MRKEIQVIRSREPLDESDRQKPTIVKPVKEKIF